MGKLFINYYLIHFSTWCGKIRVEYIFFRILQVSNGILYTDIAIWKVASCQKFQCMQRIPTKYYDIFDIFPYAFLHCRNVFGRLVMTFYIGTYLEISCWKDLFQFEFRLENLKKICLFWFTGRHGFVGGTWQQNRQQQNVKMNVQKLTKN